MAGGSAARTYNGTLTANTVDTVTLTGYSRHVVIEHLGGTITDPIYVVAAGSNTGASVTPADPTKGGADEFAIAPGQTLAIPVSGQWPAADSATWPLNQVKAKLICNTAAAYSVSLT